MLKTTIPIHCNQSKNDDVDYNFFEDALLEVYGSAYKFPAKALSQPLNYTNFNNDPQERSSMLTKNTENNFCGDLQNISSNSNILMNSTHLPPVLKEVPIKSFHCDQKKEEGIFALDCDLHRMELLKKNDQSLFCTPGIDMSTLPCGAELAKYFDDPGHATFNSETQAKHSLIKGINEFPTQSLIKKICLKRNEKKRGRPKRDPAEGWPKRPLSAYNIFFKEYRGKLVGNYDRLEISINGVRSEKSWPLRKKRKRHGMISFSDLAKTIGSKWKGMSLEEKIGFQGKAKENMTKYQEEMRLFLIKRSNKATVQETYN